MKPRRKNRWVRWSAVAVATAGIAGIGTVVSSSVSTDQRENAPIQVAVVERPSFLSELPERTAEALEAGVIAPTDIDPAAAEQLLLQTSRTTESVASAPQPAAVEEPEAEAARELFRVTASGLNVRAEPSSRSGKLFVLKQGEAVQVAEANGNWAKVVTDAGEAGWAFSKYLSPVETEPAGADIVAVSSGTEQRS